MFQDSLEVEANMISSGKMKQILELRKVREEHVPPTSIAASSSDMKFEMMINTMERLMDRMDVESRPVNKDINMP